jgi:hypothetical protein
MATYAIDGSLEPWTEVSQRHPWAALLLGNGLSINVWPRFAYGSLFDHARQGGLTDTDRALFDGTRNFERALSDLMTAMRVNDLLGLHTRPILERYRSIQIALGHAIREVHVNRARIPQDALLAIRGEMLRYEWIFTTSYDLVLYWAMGCDGWTPFVDHSISLSARAAPPGSSAARACRPCSTSSGSRSMGIPKRVPCS